MNLGKYSSIYISPKGRGWRSLFLLPSPLPSLLFVFYFLFLNEEGKSKKERICASLFYFIFYYLWKTFCSTLLLLLKIKCQSCKFERPTRPIFIEREYKNQI